MLLLEVVYGLLALWLAAYGLNSLALLLLHLASSGQHPKAEPPSKWPAVTVHLPMYNEAHVAERCIAAAATLDYPRERLQIQVLDDSTDDTARLAREMVARYAAAGLNIVYLHRPERAGFKAGALAEGLRSATGELLAIFDADFVAPVGFLRSLVPYFASPKVGCVQARWAHLNRGYSVFTRAQAMGIDGHFVIEQGARCQAGLLLNFNGSAGIWRRACIEDAGGWQTDTLTEDLDLSYRAQLAGWRFLYVPEVSAPGELPPQLEALRRQQARWALGSIQVARKLLLPLVRSGQPWWAKAEGAIHLTGYLVHPLMLATLLLTLPMLLTGSRVAGWVPYFLLATVGPPLLYLVAQLELGRAGWRELPFAPLLLLLGVGLALNNAVAMARTLWRCKDDFRRTPKFDVQSRRDGWQKSAYALHLTPLVWGELLLAGFAASQAWLAWRVGAPSLCCWLALYAVSYLYVAGMSSGQAWQRRTSRWPLRSQVKRHGRVQGGG